MCPEFIELNYPAGKLVLIEPSFFVIAVWSGLDYFNESNEKLNVQKM